jgi:hypothetical protein
MHPDRRFPLGNRYHPRAMERLVGTASPMSPIIPVGTRFETSCAGDPACSTRPSRTAVRRVPAKAGWMAARAEQDVDPQGSRDPRQDFETDAFGQAVLDHGPRTLADPAGLAQPCLGLESGEPQLPQLDGEVEDHVLDWSWLVTELVWHDVIRPRGAHHGLTTPNVPPLTAQDISQGKSSAGTVAAPAGAVAALAGMVAAPGAQFHRPEPATTRRYNRRLTGGGIAKPRLPRPPGGSSA